MRTLGNILWHVPFLGFLNAIVVYLVGLILVSSVIAAPIGLGLMEFGKFLFFPFGNAMISKSQLQVSQNAIWKTYSFIIMLVYLPLGLLIAFVCLFQVVGLLCTVIGIPVAMVVAKSLGTFLNPVNKICVSMAVADELERRKANTMVDKYLK